MAQPKTHGILGARYSTDGGTSWTEINNLRTGDQSELQRDVYGDNRPEDPHQNAYWSQPYDVIQIASLDQAAYNALMTEYEGDSRVRLELDLDNAATYTMNADHLVAPEEDNISGTREGRSGWSLGDGVRVPTDERTIV